jgi:hypothetical protein
MGEEVYKRNIITVLIVLTIMSTVFNVPKVGIAQTPFKMPYKTFQLEVLYGQSAIVYYQGTMYLNLTLTTELPMGTLYDPLRKVVYIAIYPTYSNPDLVFGIAEINITDKSYKIYRFPWYVDGVYYGPMPWTMVEDGNGELWISIRGYMVTPYHPPEYRPYLAKLNITSDTLTIYYIPGGCGNDIKFHNGYIWYLTYPFLKINATSEEIVATYPFFFDGFMRTDGDYIWITSVSSGLVTRFNTVTGTFDLNLTGFDRPLGIEVTKDAVYVAENGASDTIAVINKTTLQITRIHTGAPVTNEGPYYVYKSILGNIWWTDNSKHFGVILSNGAKIFYESVSPYNYFISELPGNIILFSCKGSTLAGIVKDVIIAEGSCGSLGGGWKALK